MSFSPQVFASGAFHFDIPNGSGKTPFSAVNPGVFRPPASPSVSGSAFLGSVTSPRADASMAHNAKRKRTLPRDSTPFSDWGTAGDANYNADTIIADRPDFDLRMDGRERQYVLAGQMDTSGAAQKGLGYIENSVYSDVDYRRALGPKRLHGDDDMTLTTTEPGDQRPAGWGSYAMSTIGGVFGKVWDFCTAGAFRGFYAGGGQGYQFSEGQGQLPMGDQAMQDQSIVAPGGLDPSPVFTSPQSDQSSFPYEPESPDCTPPPAAKRRQLWNGTPNDELQKNWVVIDEPADVNRQPFPTRALPRRSVPRPAPSLARRISKPVARLNGPNFSRQVPSRPSSAAASPISNRDVPSFTSAARSPDVPSAAPTFTPSRIPVPARPQTPSHFTPNPPPNQFTPQPAQIPSPNSFSQRSHRRNQSAASTPAIAQSMLFKRDSMHDMRDNSPRLDAKARSLAAKRMQEEMEADSRMNDFNARLRDMIRQGKEALGTKYEIESYDDGMKGGDAWESDNDEIC